MKRDFGSEALLLSSILIGGSLALYRGMFLAELGALLHHKVFPFAQHALVDIREE